MNKNVLILALAIGSFFASCEKEEERIADVDCSSVTYSATIQPIIQQSCGGAGCHGSSSIRRITNYDQLRVYVDNGSFRREVIVERTMPQGSRLSSQQLGQIQCWLDAGAPNN